MGSKTTEEGTTDNMTLVGMPTIITKTLDMKRTIKILSTKPIPITMTTGSIIVGTTATPVALKKWETLSSLKTAVYTKEGIWTLGSKASMLEEDISIVGRKLQEQVTLRLAELLLADLSHRHPDLPNEDTQTLKDAVKSSSYLSI
jgi:hypothetical protein